VTTRRVPPNRELLLSGKALRHSEVAFVVCRREAAAAEFRDVSQPRTDTRVGMSRMRIAVFVTLAMALAEASSGQTAPVPKIPGVFADDAVLELVGEGFGGAEGPVGTADGGLFFTDTGVQPTRIYRLAPDGRITLVRDDLQRANGLALDRRGALLVAESDGGRISRVEADGTVVSLVSKAEGGRALINPNDLIADERGGIYFTDFVRAQRDAPAYVYYLPPGADEAIVLSTELRRPNGLSLTKDESALIVDDTFADTLYVFDLRSTGGAAAPQPFATLRDIPEGRVSGADGLTIDRDGRLYVATTVGVQIFDHLGGYLGTLTVPGTPRNVAFAGQDKSTLYITARNAIYRIRMATQGLPRLGK